MKRPLVGMAVAGIVSIAAVGGGYAAQADDLSGLYGSVPHATERKEAPHESPRGGYGPPEYPEYENYGDHSEHAKYPEYENYGDRGGHDRHGRAPGERGSEEGDTPATGHPPEGMGGESGQDAPPEEGVLPGEGTLPEEQASEELTSEDRASEEQGSEEHAEDEAATTLPVTGGPLAVLALIGVAALAAGAALLGVARRLRYKPRH